jgi:hypothetical protein
MAHWGVRCKTEIKRKSKESSSVRPAAKRKAVTGRQFADASPNETAAGKHPRASGIRDRLD